MNKWFLHILFVCVTSMLVISCQDTEDDYMSSVNNREAQIMFTLSMDSPTARTRATWGQEQEGATFLPGDDKESRIDMSQFIVKFEADGDEYLITNILKWEDKDSKSCNFVGIVKDLDGNNLKQSITPETVKISVYVNMGSETIADDFEQSQSESTIPMWGVVTLDNKTFAPGERTNVGSVHLLRAMAKLEVTLTDEMKSLYALKGATLNKHNNTGYTLPKDAADATSTLLMDQEDVFNPKASLTETAKELAVLATDTSYVIYLPEVASTTANPLNVAVEMEEKATGNPAEGNFNLLDYSVNPDQPSDMNLVRNHWYKYEISGFAANEIKVNLVKKIWVPVDITVGGEGFLFLNKDLIEIYNSNIDTDQLKFASSSPIKSIELKDLYTHDNNGNIVEGTTDGVSAYYLSKYGLKIQLGTDPGFDITDKVAALAREKVILSNIKAEAEADKLNGGITIYSPFLAESSNEITELQQNSHYDTPRYLEFEVTNEQDLTATFRVIQYPPVVITNEEGYFSYREDFRVDDVPIQYYSDHFTKNTLGSTIPEDNGEPTHYLNPIAPFFTCADFYPYHVHEWDPVKKKCVFNPTGPIPEDIPAVCGSCGDYIGFDEMSHGLMEREYMRVDEYKGSPVSEVFHRTKYYYDNNPSTQIGSGSIYQNLGPVFEREVEVDDVDPESGEVVGKKTVKKYYRRHYTGNSFIFYFALFVQQKKYNGKAVIYSMAPTTNPVTKNEWGAWGQYKNNDGNHRMYHIRTTTASSEYTIGWPALETEGKRKYAAEGEVNSRMVSPSFMVASQLGATTVPYDRDDYDVPEEDGMYVLARRHCEQYVEAVYEDTDKSGGYTPGDSVTHYDDWRLPTRAEIELIIQYQRGSRAMDKVLTAESYFCASSTPGVYNSNTVLTYLNKTIDQWTENDYHIRCVRDVKPGQKLKKNTYPIENRNKKD